MDDVLSSHLDPKVNDKFSKWAQDKYSKLKPVELDRGKVHTFLGMELNFTEPRKCKVK